MEKQYTELLAVLNSLVALHRDLMKVEQEKLSLIIDQDWKTLELRIDESKSILNKIEECERKRLSLIERIGGNRDLALSEILQGIPDDRRQVLKDRGEELQSVLLELKSLNGRSERLLDSSLEVINFTLSLFSGAGSSTKTYSGSGREEADSGKHTSLVFDLRV